MPDVPEMSGKRRAIEMGALALLAILFLIASLASQFGLRVDLSHVRVVAAAPADLWKAVGLIVAAGLTLIMYSFLYRDNPLFKVAENLYVGVSLGYSAIITWRESLRPEVYEPIVLAPTADAFLYALLHRSLPIILGILLVTRLSRKYGWLSRYSYATMIGWGSGLAIQVVTHTFILKQLYAAIVPLQSVASKQAASMAIFSQAWFLEVVLPIVNVALVLVGTVSVLWYFFFSVEHKRAGGVVSKVGIWFLMISFGASFGYTVMGRVSLLIGRVQFLLFEWLKLPK